MSIRDFNDSRGTKKRFLRAVTINMTILLVSSFISVLIVEFGLRYYLYRSLAIPEFVDHADVMVPHPTRGWALKPDSFGYATKRDYKTGVRINSLGLRDHEHPYEKPKGVFRILLLGDSFMEAQQMPMTSSLPYLLERKLSDLSVEVINTGVNGYSPAQQLVFLREEGLQYEPDLVLAAIYPSNDVPDSLPNLSAFAIGTGHPVYYARPFPKWDHEAQALRMSAPDYERAMEAYSEARAERSREWENRSLLKRTSIYRYYQDWKHKRDHESGMAKHLSFIWYGVYLTQFDLSCIAESPLSAEEIVAAYAKAWQLTEKVFVEMARVSAEAGIPFAMFQVPDKFQIEEEFRNRLEGNACGPLKADLWAPNRKLDAMAKRNAWKFCDFSNRFVERHANDSRPLFFGWDDNHWTPSAHQVAANELAIWLKEEGLVSTGGN